MPYFSPCKDGGEAIRRGGKSLYQKRSLGLTFTTLLFFGAMMFSEGAEVFFR
jgi:hypothetical protein